MENNNWIDYFLRLCDVISSKSKDPSTKVGCVITNTGNSIISTGYNGFPIGVNDQLDKYLQTRYSRPDKYLWTSHAEQNAISFAARNGISTNGSTLYVNRMIPCARCSRIIIQAGIKQVFAKIDAPISTNDRWKQDNEIASAMMKESGVNVHIMKNYNNKICIGDVVFNKYDNCFYIFGDSDVGTSKHNTAFRKITKEKAQEQIKQYQLQIKEINTKDLQKY